MRWLACVLVSFLVATCGQKGPLTLPEEESFHATGASNRSPCFVQGAASGSGERTDISCGSAWRGNRSPWDY